MHLMTIRPETAFQALSEPTRLRILRLLVTSKAEACLCDLSNVFEEPAYKLSRHVKVLRQAGLLSAEKDGRWVYHRVITGAAHLDALYRFVSQISDLDGLYANDLRKYRKVVHARESARCQSDVRTVERKAKPKTLRQSL